MTLSESTHALSHMLCLHLLACFGASAQLFSVESDGKLPLDSERMRVDLQQWRYASVHRSENAWFTDHVASELDSHGGFDQSEHQGGGDPPKQSFIYKGIVCADYDAKCLHHRAVTVFSGSMMTRAAAQLSEFLRYRYRNLPVIHIHSNCSSFITGTGSEDSTTEACLHDLVSSPLFVRSLCSSATMICVGDCPLHLWGDLFKHIMTAKMPLLFAMASTSGNEQLSRPVWAGPIGHVPNFDQSVYIKFPRDSLHSHDQVDSFLSFQTIGNTLAAWLQTSVVARVQVDHQADAEIPQWHDWSAKMWRSFLISHNLPLQSQPCWPDVFAASIGYSTPLRQIVLQRLITTHQYASYLEIGCFAGQTFGAIDVPQKACVDPQSGGTHSMTSDTFFAHNTQLFDLIFINGDHSSPQVLKDVENSQQVLSPGGTILLHDCHPLTEWVHQDHLSGDGWRAILFLRTRLDLDVVVSNFDMGMGMIKLRPNSMPLSAELFTDEPHLDFDRHLRHFPYAKLDEIGRNSSLGIVGLAEFFNFALSVER